MAKDIDPTIGKEIRFLQRKINSLNVAIEDLKKEPSVEINYLKIVDIPSAVDSPGRAGDVAYDASWLYICVAENTWRREGLHTW